MKNLFIENMSEDELAFRDKIQKNKDFLRRIVNMVLETYPTMKIESSKTTSEYSEYKIRYVQKWVSCGKFSCDKNGLRFYDEAGIRDLDSSWDKYLKDRSIGREHIEIPFNENDENLSASIKNINTILRIHATGNFV